MDAFTLAVNFTIGPNGEPGGEEGGFSNDPNDRGGATMRGITQGEWERYIGRSVTLAEMQALSREDVLPVYHANYWNACRCFLMPSGISLQVFDHAVNHGVRASVLALQTMLGFSLNGPIQTRADGVIGGFTVGALKLQPNISALILALYDAQLAQYKTLDQWSIFGNDWGARCMRRRDAALEAYTKGVSG